jgi:hypothetical protein
LLNSDIVPKIEADSVAVSGAWSQIVADPLSGVEKIVLNFLAKSVV